MSAPTTEQHALLQTLRLKGRVTGALLAECLGMTQETLEGEAQTGVAAGWLERTENGALRLTSSGRDRLDELRREEAVLVHQPTLTTQYEEFDSLNSVVKEAVTRWQLRDGATPNDHSDGAYDAGVIAQLAAVHADVARLLHRVAETVPRLANYQFRLSAALRRVANGTHAYFASPLVDSYHQVWFELHQELIELLGRTRDEEAAEGRA